MDRTATAQANTAAEASKPSPEIGGGSGCEYGEGDAATVGRAAVRTLFWDRLDEVGVIRPKGTVEEYDRLRARIVGKLAYMAPANLETLAQLMIDAAQGPWRNRCPTEVVITNQARALEAPPLREHPIYTSWVRSVEGPPALAGGYLVELAMFVAKHVRAPGSYEMGQIKTAAAENARRLSMTKEASERGRAHPDDLEWASWYTRRLARLTDVVQEGVAKRAGQARAAGGDADEA